MKSLHLIIEFSDCIIQGKDLLSFDIIVDEDHQRALRAQMQAAEKKQGLPNQGRIEGIQCSPQKKP